MAVARILVRACRATSAGPVGTPLRRPDGRGELTRDATALTRSLVTPVSSQEPARRFADERPPQFRILRRAAVTRVRVSTEWSSWSRTSPVEAHESDLRSARSQSILETEFVAHAGGIEACWSIMSAITARMNSSASALMPPATPRRWRRTWPVRHGVPSRTPRRRRGRASIAPPRRLCLGTVTAMWSRWVYCWPFIRHPRDRKKSLTR